GSVCRGDGGGFQRAERPDHQAELHLGALGDRARAVGDCGAVEREPQPAAGFDLAAPAVVVELGDPARILRSHGTILEIGSSIIPLAPQSRRLGINVLISLLATTVCTAKPSSPKCFD